MAGPPGLCFDAQVKITQERVYYKSLQSCTHSVSAVLLLRGSTEHTATSPVIREQLLTYLFWGSEQVFFFFFPLFFTLHF